MKKFLNPEPSGGVRLTNELLFILQSEPFKAVLELYSSIAPTWVISGCDVTKEAGATICQVSAGYVFINNEVREVNATSTPFPFYIVAAADTYDTKQFGNGAIQNLLVNKTASITTVRPTSGNFLTYNPPRVDDTISKRIKPLLTTDLAAALATEIQNRTDGDTALNQSITNEINNRISGDNALQTSLNNLTAIVNTKQSRVTSKIAWQDIVIDNPYYSSTENANDPNKLGDSNLPYSKFQIMRTEDGIVHVRGYVKGNGGGTIARIPNEFRPKNTMQHVKSYVTGGNANYPGNVITTHTIEIDSIGQIIHTQRMSQVVSNNDNGAFQLIGFHPWFLTDGFSYSVE